tara:strand:- start:467 stop:1105 length:639 start_codon:yes stop_codon:yes gene_type:complete
MDNLRFKYIKLAIVITLIIACYPWENYSIYYLVKFIVGPSLLYFAIQANIIKNEMMKWFYGVFALIYNPILPPHLSREFWLFLNFLVLVLVLVDSFWLDKHGNYLKQKKRHFKNRYTSFKKVNALKNDELRRYQMFKAEVMMIKGASKIPEKNIAYLYPKWVKGENISQDINVEISKAKKDFWIGLIPAALTYILIIFFVFITWYSFYKVYG